MKFEEMIAAALGAVTKTHQQEKRRAIRERRSEFSPSQIARMREREQKKTEEAQIKEAAYAVMKEAYLKASANGTLPANARQVMYAARPLVLALTEGKCWKNSAYFTQRLLPDYLEEHADETATWDVVYDARGHLTEPHMRRSLGIGTLEVRGYMRSWRRDLDESIDIDIDDTIRTLGPANRYKFALFIEKEGFTPLLERARIGDRYDLAIFSSKGMSTTATRQLVDHLSQAGVTILVAHDFDLAGLTIAYTLGHNTRRYQFKEEPNVIDLGLRLADVTALQSESVEYMQRRDPGDKFRCLTSGDYDYNSDYDVTESELNFLVTGRNYQGWQGQRVELNAMTSDQFIAWLERKLQEHGVEKVIPDEKTLAAAYARARRIFRIRKVVDDIEIHDGIKIETPGNLGERIGALLKQSPTLSWDAALVKIAGIASGEI
jgi:hypothetical protein